MYLLTFPLKHRFLFSVAIWLSWLSLASTRCSCHGIRARGLRILCCRQSAQKDEKLTSGKAQKKEERYGQKHGELASYRKARPEQLHILVVQDALVLAGA